jgi:hypothetical protein
MNLDNIINNKLVKPSRKKQIYVPDPNRDYTRENCLRCIRLIKTGDLDPTKRAHGILLSIAHKNGYVDRKTLTILKEE